MLKTWPTLGGKIYMALLHFYFMLHRCYFYLILALMLIFSMVVVVEAQEFIMLANDKGVQKANFVRGEGIEMLITLPYDANVEVWLHNPPGTPGPSPTLFIPATSVPANIQTILGPKWLDERAPCGKYRFEIIIKPINPNIPPKTEYRYFDYATNEPPCAPITTTTTREGPTIDTIIVVSIVAIIAVIAVVIALLLSRYRAPPPKERAPVMPPTPPPSQIQPPKAPHRRTPIVVSEKREEE
jgi:hypothetical protein